MHNLKRKLTQLLNLRVNLGGVLHRDVKRYLDVIVIPIINRIWEAISIGILDKKKNVERKEEMIRE